MRGISNTASATTAKRSYAVHCTGRCTKGPADHERHDCGVATWHRAGIRIIVVTGDHPLTAVEVARRVGLDIADKDLVAADRLDEMSDATLDHLLHERRELVFARSSPETKLRIADALRGQGETVAVTGDGATRRRCE